MMRTTILKRSLALVLALVLMISSTNLGAALQVFAVENGETTVSAGELVANNYELTVAEKKLLSSGMLVGATYGYTVPTDSDLVTVDTENATVTAKNSGDWAPVTAYIVATNGTVVETVTLTNGKGSYDPKVGNAFSVKVDYTLTQNVPADVQETLLNSAAWLQTGVKGLKDSYDASVGCLGIVVMALDTLKLMADGITMNMGGFNMTARFGADAIAAVKELRAQVAANGGKLDLEVANDAYTASVSKTQYLLENGAAYKQILAETYENLLAIKNDPLTNNALLDGYLQGADNANYNKWMTFKGILTSATEAMAPMVDAEWKATTTTLVGASVNYALLDTLVAALGATTAAPAVKNPLTVASTQIQKNLSMFNVTVSVALNVVENKVGSAALVSGGETQKVVLTLAEGATAAEIEAAIAESGIVDKAKQVWGEKFNSTQFVASVNAQLPEVLMADVDYVITYNPVVYSVEVAGTAAEYPYGYQLTLPENADAAKSYDYYDADNNYYPQGTVVVIDKAMTFTRLEGKAYTTGHLLNILAGNYAADNAKVSAILNSGALTVDKVINYRQPSSEELELLVTLEGNVLTAKSYPSSYKGLSWTPDYYVVDGVHCDFAGETATMPEGFDEVSVYYSLQLTNINSKSIFDLVVELDKEAQGQKSVMDRLAGYGSQTSALNATMLGMLQSGLDNEGMKQIVGSMINEAFTNGQLDLNTIIAGYTNKDEGGLYYYYMNDAMIRNEIKVLSDHLNELLNNAEYYAILAQLLGDLGYGEYVTKLDTLSANMAAVYADLAPKNAAISTSDAGALRKLADALATEGNVVITGYGAPYISMPAVVRVSEKFAVVTVEVTVNGTSNTDPIFVKVNKGDKLTAADVASLKTAVEAFVAASGINTKYYNTNYSASELDALAKKALESNVTYKYEWTKATYEVKLPDGSVQTLDVDNRTIVLPGHPDADKGMSYEYTVDGEVATGLKTLTLEQLDKLIAGKLEITRTEKNEAVEKLLNMVNSINASLGREALTLVEKDGKYTGLKADLGADEMMKFVMGLVMESKYGYIGLGGEGLMYPTSNGSEICLQTLVNAILTDDGFNNNRLIALAQKGKGTIVTSTMQLGNSADEVNYNIDFTMSLTSVPSALTSNVSYIKTASNYLKFQAEDGVLNVDVNLPDQVYAAYAVALVAAGEVEKTDVNAIGQAVAVNFLYDYFEAIIGSDMDMVTYTNTMKMLGVNMDLTGYNNYYAAAVKAYNQCIDVAISDNGTDVDVAIPGEAAINALLKVTGAAAIPGVDTMLGMIKEYDDGETINASIHAELVNSSKTLYALIIDAQANGVTNKFAAPTSVSALKAETKNLAGYSVVMLMDDVKGDLTISGTTILDLNGKTVDGSIKSTGNLFIIDSTMDTYNAGMVTGGVSGNATIIAGNYGKDVSAYLKAGYTMDGTTVRNDLYKIVASGDSVEFVLNANAITDLPNVTALAMDIAADLVLNYGYFGSLGFDSYDLVDMHITDLIGLYDSKDVAALAKELYSCITIGVPGYENQDGFEALVNTIIADLINFEKISEGLANNTPIVEHSITLKPWKVDIAHVEDGNYATINILTNSDNAKTTNFALTVESTKNQALSKVIGELALIVEDRTEAMIDVMQLPEYAGGVAEAGLAGKANVYIDMSAANVGNHDYPVIVGVILGYGNPEKRAAIANAINEDNMGALKDIIDNTTAAQLTKALKAMGRNVNFTSMAKTVGVTVDVKSAASREAMFHTALCGMGKVLEEAAITGPAKKLGGLYNEETGYYTISLEDLIGKASYNTSYAVEIRSYLAVLNLEATELSLNVKLFGEVETCLIGDVNHDTLIDGEDATLALQYYAEMEPSDYFCFRGANTDGNDVIDGADATLILQYYAEMIDVFPAENK